METLFQDAEIISAYTRRQAIEDGVLVQLSGPGYEGDRWIPEMVAEVGIRAPLAMTSAVFHDCVHPIDGDLPPTQDIKGRLWDVLYMMVMASRSHRNDSQFCYTLLVVPNGDKWTKPKTVELKTHLGPGDTAEAVMTISYPHED